MKLEEISNIHECRMEECYIDQSGKILSERAIRQWKRNGGTLVKKYRCLTGPKKNKLVSSPTDCGKRKDPKKVRRGKKVMRMKKGVIQQKSKVSKRKTISKILRKMNKRLKNK